MKIDIIETGVFALDGGAMFGVIPKALWAKAYNTGDDKNRIPLAARLLLIRDAERVILIDTGNGNKFSDKLCAIYGIDKEQSDILAALAKVGVKAEDVTDVILTHLHFDHAGGATYHKDGVVVPTFPNAVYHVQQKQFDHALNPSLKDRASFIPENFMPLFEAGKLNLIDGAKELFPGIELIPVNGHTPAMQLVKIKKGEETILYCADLIPTAAHIPIPYVMGYDNYPMTTINEKLVILEEALNENAILFYEHDAFTKASRLLKDAKGYKAGETVDLYEI